MEEPSTIQQIQKLTKNKYVNQHVNAISCKYLFTHHGETAEGEVGTQICFQKSEINLWLN